MKCEEWEIPVPWGHVAVKCWGNKSNCPILVLHGLGDNAGSFDGLIPLLPSSFYYMCIDLPGQGKSSPYPPYVFMTAWDNIMTIKLILDHLDRKKYIFLGHSWGGQTAITFAQLFPQYCTKLIILDTFYFYPLTISIFKEILVNSIEGLIKTNKFVTSEKITYTYDEAINKLMNSRLDGIPLDMKSAEAIAKRCLTKDGQKYSFNNDPRLKYVLNLVTDIEFCSKTIEKFPVQCPILIIHSTDFQYNFFKKIVDKWNNLSNCTMVKVEGGHDIHCLKPKEVASVISKFLLKSVNKL